jgi:hypothetical protein
MFKDENEFKNIVNKLNIDTKSNPAHREKLKTQMLSVFDKTSHKHRTNTLITDILRAILKSPITKIFSAAAAVLMIVLFLTINSSGTLYAQVATALRKVNTLHVFGEYGEGQDLYNFDTWYSKDIGLSRYDYHGDQTTIRLYDDSHLWQYSSDSKYAIQSNHINPDYFINALLNITPNQDFAREASGDKVIDGFKCKLYVSYNDNKTRQNKMWLDDANRVRYTEYSYQKQDGDWWRSYSHFKYDIAIDSKVFSKDFGANVTIVDPEKMLDKAFSIEKAIYSEESLGLIFAVHTAELCRDGTIYIVCSVRPNENSRGIAEQNDPRVYNFGRSILMIGNTFELSQAYHNGIEIKWYAIYGSNFPNGNTLRLQALIENNGELERYRQEKGMETWKSVTTVVPLTESNRTIKEILDDVYSQATVLEPEMATVRLDISREAVPDATGRSRTGIVYKQRLKIPSEISLNEYINEIMTDIERLKQNEKK